MSEVKKPECAVARDLIPLYIDGAAAPETSEYLKKHLEGCPDCAAYAAALKEAPRGAKMSAEDRKDFAAIARRMRRRVLRRMLLTMAAGALMIVALYGCYRALWETPNLPMPLEHYTAAVYALKSGDHVLTLTDHGTRMMKGWGYSTGGTNRTLAVHEHTSIIPRPGTGRKTVQIAYNMRLDRIDAIVCRGPGNVESVVWRRGDPVPPASEELERYVALHKEKEIGEIQRSSQRSLADVTSRFYDETPAEQSLAALEKELDALRPEVPEFGGAALPPAVPAPTDAPASARPAALPGSDAPAASPEA